MLVKNAFEIYLYGVIEGFDIADRSEEVFEKVIVCKIIISYGILYHSKHKMQI